MFRKLVLAGIAATVLSLGIAAPAMAGPAETAFLQKLVSVWSGKGKVTGAEAAGTVLCKMEVKGSGGSVKYVGRCTIPDVAPQSFSGSIVYNDSKQRYEARAAGGSVVGVKRGNSLVFTTKRDTLQGTSYTTMTLSPSRFVINLTLIDRRSGQKTVSSVTFTK